jgi:GNAT superfamily N-acetyltransferase
VNKVTQRMLLSQIESFYDAVPRRGAAVETFGTLTLFIRAGAGWPLYARPTLGAPAPDVNSVHAVRARQRELGLPEAFEWVDEVTPGLAPVAAEAGLAILRCPLMVLSGPPATAGDAKIDFLSPDDDGTRSTAVNRVAAAAFGAPEPAFAPLPELDAEGLRSDAIARCFVTAPDGQIVSVGSYQRAGDVIEIVGVATLPSARRRGLAGAVTGALARHALDSGAQIVFMSAGTPEAARVYGRLGFVQVATACVAEPG